MTIPPRFILQVDGQRWRVELVPGEVARDVTPGEPSYWRAELYGEDRQLVQTVEVDHRAGESTQKLESHLTETVRHRRSL